MDVNQHRVYLGWVNAQLKKRTEPRLITDLTTNMADGVVLADLIEVVAKERIEVIVSPLQHSEKVANVDKVLRFMRAKRIPMHPINAEDIVLGDIRSIMRLILALAARYKPNTVKQTSRHSNPKASSPHSVVSYAQSAAAALADARKNVSVIVPKQSKPSSLVDQVICEPPTRSNNETRTTNTISRLSSSSSKSSQSIPKSSSQDFSRNSGRSEKSNQVQTDNRYEDLVNAYRVLDSSRRELQLQFDQLQSVYHDVCLEMKILRKSLLSLHQLLEQEGEDRTNGELTSSETEEGLVSTEVSVLRNRLTLSEEICADIKEDLSKTRNECLRLQGSEAGLQQRLRHQQKVLFDLKAELRNASNEIETLTKQKNELEMQLLAKNERLAELTAVRKSQSGNSSESSSGVFKRQSVSLQKNEVNGPQVSSSKVIYFLGKCEVPLMCSTDKRNGSVTLRDVKTLLKSKSRCRYKFWTRDPEHGFVKKEIVQDDVVVPEYDGTIMVWMEEK